jgi:two-component system, NarL family, sensor kinase
MRPVVPTEATHANERRRPDLDLDLPELRRAERTVLYIRWAVMLAWLPILQHADVPDRDLMHSVQIAVALYTLATHVLVLRAKAIRKVAFATMLGDATGVFAMCLVTGGIASDVYPYFYLHVLTTAIRFDARETFAALLLDTLFSIGLYEWAQAASVAPRDLMLVIFYLSVTAAIAGRLSRDAKTQYRRAVREGDARHELVWRLLHAEEEERRRIAGEIHDRMGQRFFHFQYVIDRWRDRLGSSDSSARAAFDELGDGIRDLSDEVRAVMSELRPTSLDDFGFIEALREYVAAAPSHPRITLSVDENVALQAQAGAAMFRIVQEALLNIRKHARADAIWIELGRRDDATVELCIRDDGIGFDPSLPVRGHFGLLTVRERAEALGGRLELRSGPGNGTELRIVVPMGQESKTLEKQL